MMEIKRLADCTFNEALTAWNTGFEGYFADMTMTHEAFLRRFPLEDLSPALSVVAFIDGEPAGLILSGIRTLKGVKTAWNGGTAVAVKFRQQGVGRALMEKTLAIYEEEGVQLAMLEAIEGNDKAIALYESLGYKNVDHLEYLELKGKLDASPLEHDGSYTFRKVHPLHAGLLPFYKGGNPWQTHWQSAKDAEAVILTDRTGKEAGYAYFRKSFNEEGAHISTVIYQSEADETREDARKIIQSLLGCVIGQFDDEIRRIVLNLPAQRSKIAHSVLKEIGFTPFVNQVMMNREM
ncbi:GNAT family N-acetyltransferase [Neobacillus notoginsengisoli]|uniref:GNAT family N-acetyltransferase n=1 Tax=Neobacillus notoginsengisoli TaxID=1578198 RepID=A0A417YPY3_9BACI|nr:GNAT family N-acetyltransferase [Neobacillus notoginsengisoli]RHW35680.1 GNAT family N-acetyltransferase [Neobacillus notoginsengisoli]